MTMIFSAIRAQISQFIDWYRRRSQWHDIRALGFSSIVKISIVAPIVGYLILSNKFAFSFFEGWKFYFFYAGVTCISLGAILYSWWCPGEAKKYDTGVEYAISEVDFFIAKPMIIESLLREKISRLRVSRPDILHLDLLTIGSKFWTSSFDQERDKRKDAVIFLMDELWHAINYQFRKIRVICRMLYDAGILLLFAPSVYTTLQVLGVLPRP